MPSGILKNSELGYDYPISRYQLIIQSLLSFIPEESEKEKVRQQLGDALTHFKVEEVEGK